MFDCWTYHCSYLIFTFKYYLFVVLVWIHSSSLCFKIWAFWYRPPPSGERSQRRGSDFRGEWRSILYVVGVCWYNSLPSNEWNELRYAVSWSFSVIVVLVWIHSPSFGFIRRAYRYRPPPSGNRSQCRGSGCGKWEREELRESKGVVYVVYSDIILSLLLNELRYSYPVSWSIYLYPTI